LAFLLPLSAVIPTLLFADTHWSKVQGCQMHVASKINNSFLSFLSCYALFEIDKENLFSDRRTPKIFFLFDGSAKSIKKMHPHLLEIFPTWAADAHEVVFQGITGKWLAVWCTDKSLVKGTLHFLDQETLVEDFSYDFSKSPETPLPPFDMGHVYIQDKFCIVLSPEYSIIKIDGRTVRIDQKTMRPFLDGFTSMTNFSCIKQPDGQMELNIAGETVNESICWKYTADPFEPLTKIPKPTEPILIKTLPVPDLPTPPSRLFKLLKWAAAVLCLFGLLKLLRKALAR